MMMPDSLRMATLFPDAAMRVSRPADPLSCVDMDEKVSDYRITRKHGQKQERGTEPKRGATGGGSPCCQSHPAPAHCRRCRWSRRGGPTPWPTARLDGRCSAARAHRLPTWRLSARRGGSEEMVGFLGPGGGGCRYGPLNRESGVDDVSRCRAVSRTSEALTTTRLRGRGKERGNREPEACDGQWRLEG